VSQSLSASGVGIVAVFLLALELGVKFYAYCVLGAVFCFFGIV
jgi:hypothetical protein